jgi:hypothetical protein
VVDAVYELAANDDIISALQSPIDEEALLELSRGSNDVEDDEFDSPAAHATDEPAFEVNDIETGELQARKELDTEESETMQMPTEMDYVPEGTTIAWNGQRNQSQLECDSPNENPSPNLFELALGIWADKISLSREDYVGLLEVASLAKPEDWTTLPKTLDTLQKRYRDTIPTPAIYSKSVAVSAEKQPTGSSLSGQSPVFFLNVIQAVQTILNSPAIRQKMYFGMAKLVDRPQELWHSESWAESIRTCSGEFAKYSSGKPIFPSDSISYYRMEQQTRLVSVGRIRCIYRDERVTGSGGITMMVQRICHVQYLPAGLQDLVTNPPPLPGECILMEDLIDWVSPKDVISPVTGFFDRKHHTGEEQAAEQKKQMEELNKKAAQAEARRKADDAKRLKAGQPAARRRPTTVSSKGVPTSDIPNASEGPSLHEQHSFYVRRILNITDRKVRSFRLSHPVRAELELETYSRETLEAEFCDPSKVLCLPHIMFIDGFGVYRNMYKSLTGVYLIPSNLPLKERSRLVNIFPITLGPHGSNLDDVLACLEPAMKALEKGLPMMLNVGNGCNKELRVCSLALGFIGDTPQQNENAGFLRSNAVFGCRACFIPSQQYDDLDFDIVTQGRYHYEVCNYPMPIVFVFQIILS